MLHYIIKRFVQSLLVIWLVVTAAFFMIKATPGNPFASDKASTKFVVEQNMKIYGLDKPLSVQYVRFWTNALQGEFGYSLQTTIKCK